MRAACEESAREAEACFAGLARLRERSRGLERAQVSGAPPLTFELFSLPRMRVRLVRGEGRDVPG